MDTNSAIIEKIVKTGEDYANLLSDLLEVSFKHAGIKKSPQEHIHHEIFNSWETALDRYIKVFDIMVVGRYSNEKNIKIIRDKWFVQEKNFRYGALGFLLDVYNIDHLAFEKPSLLYVYNEDNDDYEGLLRGLALSIFETLEKKGYPYYFILGTFLQHEPFLNTLKDKDIYAALPIHITNYFAFFKSKFDK